MKSVARHNTLLKLAKQAPTNTSKWPEAPSGYNVVFKPYGKQGRGFYLVVVPLPLP